MLTPDLFEIFLDSDLREDNGPDGFEWAMHAEFPLNSALFMWNGSDYVRESTTLIFTAGQGEVTAMLNVRQLGSETVRFYVRPSISCRARVARKTLSGKGSWKTADIPSSRCREQRAESR